MYKLQRFFYHKLCLQPVNYYIDEKLFDGIVELNDFVYNTYRNNYTIETHGMDYILHSNDMITEIHCVVSQE